VSRINNSIAIKQLIQNYNEFQHQQQQHTLQKPSIPQQIIEEISVIEDKYLQQSITNIKILLQSPNQTSIDDTIDFIINTTNQSWLATQKARLSLINDTIATSTVDQSFDEINISENELTIFSVPTAP
jgi:hypothetical protein